MGSSYAIRHAFETHLILTSGELTPIKREPHPRLSNLNFFSPTIEGAVRTQSEDHTSGDSIRFDYSSPSA